MRGARLKLAHVGDSRAFSLRDGLITCLTEDHSVENEAKRRRARGEVVYYSETQRGAPDPLHPASSCRRRWTLVDLPLLAGDRYLFCTDGVTRLVSEPELGQLLGEVEDPGMIAREIVGLAVHRGGPDNATVVVVIIDEP